jgi:hypothetical protein
LIIGRPERGRKPPRYSSQSLHRPGRASATVRPLAELQPGEEVILVGRVSERPQAVRGNLAEQLQDMRAAVQAKGAIIVGAFDHVGPGWQADHLYAPVLAALGRHRRIRPGASLRARGDEPILVARDVSRFIRNPSYDGRHDHAGAVPTEADLRYLAQMTFGLRLMTVLDPDASPNTIRGYQTRTGMAAKANMGGRPVKGRKLFRLKWQDAALRLHGDGL